MTTTEPTVEQYLEELREMFPSPRESEIIHLTVGSVIVAVWDNADDERGLPPHRVVRVQRDTLSEAMAQVRSWHAQRSSSTPLGR